MWHRLKQRHSVQRNLHFVSSGHVVRGEWKREVLNERVKFRREMGAVATPLSVRRHLRHCALDTQWSP
jgi:hypothetical protein